MKKTVYNLIEENRNRNIEEFEKVDVACHDGRILTYDNVSNICKRKDKDGEWLVFDSTYKGQTRIVEIVSGHFVRKVRKLKNIKNTKLYCVTFNLSNSRVINDENKPLLFSEESDHYKHYKNDKNYQLMTVEEYNEKYSI